MLYKMDYSKEAEGGGRAPVKLAMRASFVDDM
jgi:hypothetical protein